MILKLFGFLDLEVRSLMFVTQTKDMRATTAHTLKINTQKNPTQLLEGSNPSLVHIGCVVVR